MELNIANHFQRGIEICPFPKGGIENREELVVFFKEDTLLWTQKE